MKPAIKLLIAIARAELGVVELTGKNDNPRIEMFLNKRERPLAAGEPADRRMSWCAAFVLWCLWRAGLELKGNFWAMRRVSTLLDVAKACGAVLTAGEAIEPGDLVVWLGSKAHESAGPSGHVAMVTETKAGGSELRTIGGNERLQTASGGLEGVNERWLSAQKRAAITAVIRPGRMQRAA